MAKATPKKAAPAAKSTAAKSTGKKAAPAKKAPVKAPAKKAAPASKKAAPAAKSTGKKAAPAKKAPVKKAAPAAKKSAPAAKKEAPAKKAAPVKAVAPVAKKAAPAKPTPPPKPVKLVSPYDAKFLDAQRELLIEERARYTRSANRLASEAAALVEDMEPGDVQFDEESGEGDTIVVERERDLAMSAQALQAVADIDAALGRIADGVYGLSIISGQPIPKERLRAIPWAAERVEEKVGGLGTTSR
jgi:RNA polymerase-binding transcription factor DksA